MKKYSIIAVFILGVGGVLSIFAQTPQKVSFHGSTYTLEVADTDASRMLGLGERDFLCETCGMLFVFEKPGNQGFWMKGMRFPLDIVWLLDDQVVYIERHVSEKSQDIYYPGTPSNQVLEFRSGTADNLKRGDRVSFSHF